MSNNIFSDDFNAFDEYSERKAFDELQRRFSDHEDRKEAMKKHPAGKSATKTPRVSDEASTLIGLAVFKFLFVTIPLALLFAGLAVVPFTGAVFGTDLGFWTAFFVLATLRWLIPRPRKQAPLEEFYAKRGR